MFVVHKLDKLPIKDEKIFLVEVFLKKRKNFFEKAIDIRRELW